jgi:hypothetical protein
MITALFFFTIAASIVVLNHLIYKAIDNYDNYGNSPKEDWASFERLKNNGWN